MSLPMSLNTRPVRFGRAAVLAAGMAFGLSGCFATSTTPMAYSRGCLTDRIDIVENASWEGVQPNHIRIVDDSFRPMVMYVEKNRPYILKIENADPHTHSFWAPGFLKQGVALESVQIGDKAPAKGCVNAVRIEGRSEVTLKFVPVWDGRYEFFNGTLPLLTGSMASGVIHVVNPRIGIASK